MTTAKTWKCEICGYIHEGSAPPSVCPICGVGPEMFVDFTVSSTVIAEKQTTQWRCTICDYVHTEKEPPQLCPICSAGRDHFESTEVIEVQPSSDMVGPIVIVGAGVAGFTAAEKARATCKNVEITLINKESTLPYYRLNLTRFLAGEIDESGLPMQPAQWFEKNQIQLVKGEVAAVLPAKRVIELKNGEKIGYDKLILANGSHGFVPPFVGVTRKGVHVLRTLEDTRLILDDVKQSTKCVCIGGGLLGIEAAGALKKRGADVSIVEGFGWLLPRQLPETAGKMLAKYIDNFGIKVFSNAIVKEIAGDESVSSVSLQDGRELPADIVIISTGIRPNSYLARRSDLKVVNGVLVDDTMQTSNPDIFAAGDVAEHRGTSFGIWPVAYGQGAVAGINAAGGEAQYLPAPPSNRLKVMDVDLFSIGIFSKPDAGYQICEKVTDQTFTRLLIRDGRLHGGVLYGDTSAAGPLKDAVEQGVQLREATELLKKLPLLADYIETKQEQ